MFTSPIGAIMSADDPLADCGQVDLGELSSRPLVLFPRYMAAALYDEIVHTCRDAGYMPSAFVHARNREFAYGMVIGRRGVYLQTAQEADLPPELKWVPLTHTPLSWRTSALWKKSRETPRLRQLVAAVGTGLERGGHVPL
jgi:DNA-binding transcriptional LysR family regulator